MQENGLKKERTLEDLTEKERSSLIEIYIKTLRAIVGSNGYESRQSYEREMSNLLNTGLSANIQEEERFFFEVSEGSSLPYEYNHFLRGEPALTLVKPYGTFDRIRESLMKEQFGDYLEKATFSRPTTHEEAIKLLTLDDAMHCLNNFLRIRANNRINSELEDEKDEKRKKELFDERVENYFQNDYGKEFDELYKTVYGHIIEKKSKFKDTLETSKMIKEISAVSSKANESNYHFQSAYINNKQEIVRFGHYEEPHIRALELLSKYNNDPEFQDLCRKVFNARGLEASTFYAIESMDTMRNYSDGEFKKGFSSLTSLVLDPHFDIQFAMSPFYRASSFKDPNKSLEEKQGYVEMVQLCERSFQLDRNDFTRAGKDKVGYLAFKAGVGYIEKYDPYQWISDDSIDLARDKNFWECYGSDTALLLGVTSSYIGTEPKVDTSSQKEVDFIDVKMACEDAFRNLYAVRQSTLSNMPNGLGYDEKSRLLYDAYDKASIYQREYREYKSKFQPQPVVEQGISDPRIGLTKEQFNSMSPEEQGQLLQKISEYEGSKTNQIPGENAPTK